MSERVNWDSGLEPPDVKECECTCHDPIPEGQAGIRWIEGHCFLCEVDEDDYEPALD